MIGPPLPFPLLLSSGLGLLRGFYNPSELLPLSARGGDPSFTPTDTFFSQISLIVPSFMSYFPLLARGEEPCLSAKFLCKEEFHFFPVGGPPARTETTLFRGV